MSNNIGSFHSGRFNPYQRINTPSDGASNPTAPTPPEQTEATQSTQAPDAPESAASMQELSAAEREMIQKKFPQDPDLSMRLYGPNRSTQQVNPGVLGQNLDVSG